MPPVSDLPSPGWYTDPEKSEDYRYWDGSKWTDHRSPRYRHSSGHRDISDLLTGTWRMLADNWRALGAMCAVIVVVFLVGASIAYRGYDDVFGNTLTVLLDELESLEPGAEPEDFQNALDDQWDQLTARLRGFGTSTLARGVLTMALGVLVATAANTVEFAAFGHFTLSRLNRGALGAAAALRAGLKRLLRMFGVGLMLVAIGVAALMVASLVSGVISLAAGVPGVVLGVLLLLAVLVGMVGAAPLALLAVMTAAVGPATPSLRYARNLLRVSYWATFGRMALVAVLYVILSVALELLVGVLGFLGTPASFAVSAAVSVFPELLFSIACFTIYHDLGGENSNLPKPAA